MEEFKATAEESVEIVITLQLVQALVPVARSLGACMGKAFCLFPLHVFEH